MIIEMKNINKKYGKTVALKDIELKLETGIYGLLGKNGAGKTTLLNIFMGITEADCGEIYIDGKRVKELGSSFLDKLGYLPQYCQFYKEFSVYDFLEYMGALKGIPSQVCKERIDELLEAVNLSDYKKKRIAALSGGMRQRLGIVQAILNNPSILILDEPTAGLDPQERINFRNLVADLSENKIILLATHIVSDVEYIANEIIIMDMGEIICRGSSEELAHKLDGQVWEVKKNRNQDKSWMEKYLISNIRREGDDLIYHIVGENPGKFEALKTEANLEDVFLYHCRRENVCGS